jgi:hypothetical protein
MRMLLVLEPRLHQSFVRGYGESLCLLRQFPQAIAELLDHPAQPRLFRLYPDSVLAFWTGRTGILHGSLLAEKPSEGTFRPLRSYPQKCNQSIHYRTLHSSLHPLLAPRYDPRDGIEHGL